MEIRIAKMEKEIALMSQSLQAVAATLEKMSKVQLDTMLLEEKFLNLDRDLQESFKRVHKRIDEEAQARAWVVKIVIGSVVAAMMGVVLNGGI